MNAEEATPFHGVHQKVRIRFIMTYCESEVAEVCISEPSDVYVRHGRRRSHEKARVKRYVLANDLENDSGLANRAFVGRRFQIRGTEHRKARDPTSVLNLGSSETGFRIKAIV